MRRPRAQVLKVAALQVGLREVPRVVQPAELLAVRPVVRLVEAPQAVQLVVQPVQPVQPAQPELRVRLQVR